MKNKVFSKNIKVDLQSKFKGVKDSVQMPDLKSFSNLLKHKKDIFQSEVEFIPLNHAMALTYFLMNVDGEISSEELRQFEEIGDVFTSGFADVMDDFIHECNVHMKSFSNVKDLIEDEFRIILEMPFDEEMIYINGKHLVWNLYTVAFSDGCFQEDERNFVLFVAEKLKVDDSVLAEFEHSLLTMNSLKKELDWIKHTDRSYLEIEKVVNEINNRMSVISNGISDLIFN